MQNLKIPVILNNCYLILDSMHKKLNDFPKKFAKFKNVHPRTKENEDLKVKVLDNIGDLFNDLYYIYKERCEEEKIF